MTKIKVRVWIIRVFFNFIFILSLLLLSCTKTVITDSQIVRNEISIKASVLRTRSSTDLINFETHFSKGDTIGVYIVRGDSFLKSSGNYIDNSPWIYDGIMWKHVGKPLLYPQDADKIAVFAYYPYKKNVDPTSIEISVGENQTEEENELNDFMTAIQKDIISKDEQISLYFTHQLSLVQVKVNGLGEGAIIDTKSLKVKLLDCIIKANYNFNDKMVIIKNGSSDIEMKLVDSVNFIYRAWLPPQKKNGDLLSFTQQSVTFLYDREVDLLPNEVSVIDVSLDPNLDLSHRYRIGDIYPYKGFPLGVVCWIKDNKMKGTEGKIISLQQRDLMWSSEVVGINTSSENGQYNTELIVNNYNISNYPAFKWCVDYGEDWYFPAEDEVLAFKDIIKDLNNTLINYEGMTIQNKFYWSSSASDNLSFSIGVHEDITKLMTKTEELPVRAFRKFSQKKY